MHDLRIERGWQHQQEWVYVWCPCGWKTDIKYVVATDPTTDLKRQFHEHLRPAEGGSNA
jgi:hypothetical protein